MHPDCTLSFVRKKTGGYRTSNLNRQLSTASRSSDREVFGCSALQRGYCTGRNDMRRTAACRAIWTVGFGIRGDHGKPFNERRCFSTADSRSWLLRCRVLQSSLQATAYSSSLLRSTSALDVRHNRFVGERHHFMISHDICFTC